MTDNEIVKALECCPKAEMICDCKALKCPNVTKRGCKYILNGDCDRTTSDIIIGLSTDALDLINRLQEENEKKDRAFKELIEVAKLWKQKYYETKAENEKLKAEVDCYKNWYFNAVEGIKTANDRIDNLLKELVGEDNG